MKIGVQKTGLYHFDVYARKFIFFKQKIGRVTTSLDGERIDLYLNPKWQAYARDIAEFIGQNYVSKQFNKQSS